MNFKNIQVLIFISKDNINLAFVSMLSSLRFYFDRVRNNKQDVFAVRIGLHPGN